MILSGSIDCAYVAVPHHLGRTVSQQLLASNIHVLKEKPAAMTRSDLQALQELDISKGLCFTSASQLRYSDHFRQMQEWLPRIGHIRLVDGIRHIFVEDLGVGWRANRELAGGGVLIDLGWHLVNLMLCLIGDGSRIEIDHAWNLHTRSYQQYNVEDTSSAVLDIQNEELAPDGAISCRLLTTRNGPEETSQLTIYGSSGILRMDETTVSLKVGNALEISNSGWFST